MTTPYKAIAFDLDGTLVDSVPDIYLAASLATKSQNLPDVTLDQVRQWIGNGLDVLAARMLSNQFVVKDDLDPQILTALRQSLFSHYADNVCVDSTLYPAVTEILSSLKDAGYILAVITNKNREFTLPVLSHLKIESFIDMVVCGDDVEEKKPHPASLHAVLHEHSLKPDEMLMVGDSKNDILAAQRANCPVVAIDGGYNQGVDLRSLEPTYFLNSFAELSFLLDSK